MISRNNKQFTIADNAINHKKKANEFLDRVDYLIDWIKISSFLKKKLNRKSNAVGNPAYPALPMFKILLLQRWYNLSDPATEQALLDRLSFLRFIDFSIEQEAPDETTICRFRNGLIRLGIFEELLEMVNEQLQAKGLLVKEGVAVDASVVSSCDRPRKTLDIVTEDRKESDDTEVKATISYSKDEDAKWLKKGNCYHYGYKIHVAVDKKNGFVLAGHTTSANKSDTGEFTKLVTNCKLPNSSLVLADKGYTSKTNRDFLAENSLTDGIMQKASRGKVLDEAQKLFNKNVSKVRYIVERAFGTMKRQYEFQRARYRGLKKVNAELHLIAMAYNIKKAVLLT